jgi:hypothetical protein
VMQFKMNFKNPAAQIKQMLLLQVSHMTYVMFATWRLGGGVTLREGEVLSSVLVEQHMHSCNADSSSSF